MQGKETCHDNPLHGGGAGTLWPLTQNQRHAEQYHETCNEARPWAGENRTANGPAYLGLWSTVPLPTVVESIGEEVGIALCGGRILTFNTHVLV